MRARVVLYCEACQAYAMFAGHRTADPHTYAVDRDSLAEHDWLAHRRGRLVKEMHRGR